LKHQVDASIFCHVGRLVNNIEAADAQSEPFTPGPIPARPRAARHGRRLRRGHRRRGLPGIDLAPAWVGDAGAMLKCMTSSPAADDNLISEAAREQNEAIGAPCAATRSSAVGAPIRR